MEELTMKQPTTNKLRLSWLTFTFGSNLLVLPLSGALAATPTPTDLADIPLANSSAVTVLPNIFFILDNSGSMHSNYMPDYVNDTDAGYCRSGQVYSCGRFSCSWSSTSTCQEGDPPFNASAFNSIYYNPAVTYTPPVEADKTTKKGLGTWLASSKNWTGVPIDGYGILDTGTINLTNGYPERKWCNSTALTTCKSALNGASYSYPDTTYKYENTVNGAPYYYTATVEWCSNSGLTTCQSRKTSTYKYPKYSSWSRVDIKPATTSYAKASTRTDCSGSTCTYDEEMANFANWYAWYRTRTQMMKTSMGLAFKEIRGTPDTTDPDDGKYFHSRVGYTTISYAGTTAGTSFLPLDAFDSTQRSTFYSDLYAADGNSYTPLRGALSKAGRIYAGAIGYKKADGTKVDPIQYSCQKNYTILSTDGYWNTDTETSTYKALKIDGTSDVGDRDGADPCNTANITPICNDSGNCFTPTSTDPVAATTTAAKATRPECDKLKKSNTLADIAYYYYHTDLRPDTGDGKTCATRSYGKLTDCTNNVRASGTDPKLDDVATWQHMTTYTIGIGLSSTLAYQSDYKTATTGDFSQIKDGTKSWPDPTDTEDDERIDDLWHTAVNGRGKFFPADNPLELSKGLQAALSAIAAEAGEGAAAATSSLNMVQGTNGYVYLAKYQTAEWTSDILAYTFDSSNNTISTTTAWLAQGLLDAKISGTCGDAESRLIYTGATTRKTFTWADLTATERAYFDNSKLSQYADWNAATRTYAGSGELLLNYIRGHNRYEDRSRDTTWQASCPTYNRLYRNRAHVLGDIVHSQPFYVQKSWANYADTGYSSFKSGNESRAPRLYAGANDGMLHAFDANTGAEVWAYVPPLVIPGLYRLADTYYGNNHRYFVDGPTVVSDFNDGGTWKTLLVGALGKGGRGIYALDITGTSSAYPKVLWNFTAADDSGVGFSYGAPLVAKLRDGTWVVVLSSGYNNLPGQPYTGDYPTSDGKGHLYVIRASDGHLLRRIDTGVEASLGDVQISVNDRLTDATAIKAYAGDLAGNLWSFDLDSGTVHKVAALGSDTPIQAAPEVTMVQGLADQTVVYVGTGRYLGKTDIDTTSASNVNLKQQYIFGIKDDGVHTVVQSELTEASSTRLDWSTGYGWYYKLGTNELVYLAPSLYQGTLAVASVIPTAEACKPGGSGNLYQFDNRSGELFKKSEFSAPPAGFTWYTYTSSSGSKSAGLIVSTADGKTPSIVSRATGGDGGGSSCTDGGPACHNLATGDRIMWRELPSE
jgi:type IV pilus assembly protein PilY1